MLDSKGRALVDGQVLPAGEEEGPFHSGSFTVAFGNGEVAMRIDGKDIRTPASASPLGYSIEPGGHLTPSEAERPTCLTSAALCSQCLRIMDRHAPRPGVRVARGSSSPAPR